MPEDDTTEIPSVSEAQAAITQHHERLTRERDEALALVEELRQQIHDADELVQSLRAAALTSPGMVGTASDEVISTFVAEIARLNKYAEKITRDISKAQKEEILEYKRDIKSAQRALIKSIKDASEEKEQLLREMMGHAVSAARHEAERDAATQRAADFEAELDRARTAHTDEVTAIRRESRGSISWLSALLGALALILLCWLLCFCKGCGECDKKVVGDTATITPAKIQPVKVEKVKPKKVEPQKVTMDYGEIILFRSYNTM